MTPPASSIRAYRTDDFAAVVNLVKTVLTEYGLAAANVGSVERDLGELEVNYGQARAGFWVAELDGIIVGTVAIRPKVDQTCELKRLYVAKSARGQGVGRALYAHAEAFARSAGYDRIWLDSSRHFTEARRLYERNGFTLIEEIQNEWCDNVYEKKLM